jgi:hypothetical protein
MKNAYSIINDDYLEEKAIYLSHFRGLNGVKSDNVIAVLSESTTCLSMASLTAPKQAVVHEANQSEAQIRESLPSEIVFY